VISCSPTHPVKVFGCWLQASSWSCVGSLRTGRESFTALESRTTPTSCRKNRFSVNAGASARGGFDRVGAARVGIGRVVLHVGLVEDAQAENSPGSPAQWPAVSTTLGR